MPSLHSTLAVLMENLVRDLLVAVRESSLHELASSGSPQSAAKKAASKKEKPPSRPSPKVRAKARRAPSKTTKAKPLERVRVVFAEPPQVEQGDLDAQITDPDGLLRETARTVPVPRPTEAAAASTVDVREGPSTPTLREGEDLLRTASGRTVLRRRRDRSGN
jgi:hypothetical protein